MFYCFKKFDIIKLNIHQNSKIGGEEVKKIKLFLFLSSVFLAIPIIGYTEQNYSELYNQSPDDVVFKEFFDSDYVYRNTNSHSSNFGKHDAELEGTKLILTFYCPGIVNKTTKVARNIADQTKYYWETPVRWWNKISMRKGSIDFSSDKIFKDETDEENESENETKVAVAGDIRSKNKRFGDWQTEVGVNLRSVDFDCNLWKNYGKIKLFGNDLGEAQFNWKNQLSIDSNFGDGPEVSSMFTFELKW